MFRPVKRSSETALPGRPVKAAALLLAGLLFAVTLTQNANAAGSDGASNLGLAEPIPALPELSDATSDQVDGSEHARALGNGIASYYGKRFAGRPTASGELFDPAGLTAAHRSLPFGSKVLVTSKRTGKSVIVRINDRGPFHRGRVIDLSKAAASRIGLVRQGLGSVNLALLAK
jgi:rare lipoprotein A